ncbi:hypothetical protein TNIN_75941 [Trichonephila inaurata madagascariensis]|uniref:Uncharacterized protein n=1 Tax=Trichonephila inaurata madagascariensis TaxID=2747483 RepID=A0A8X6X5A7_9ARAC|nr:hypothetical protein TNIN_75941 [Trichonephila inaurata madagascariensis]
MRSQMLINFWRYLMYCSKSTTSNPKWVGQQEEFADRPSKGLLTRHEKSLHVFLECPLFVLMTVTSNGEFLLVRAITRSTGVSVDWSLQ